MPSGHNPSDPGGPAMPVPPPPPADPDPDDARLATWQRGGREPVFYSEDPAVWTILAACWEQRSLSVRYWGGTEPGGRRTIRPRSVFTVRGYRGIWCEAWCETRQAWRTFRLDRLVTE